MADTTPSPVMNLPVPNVGVDAGPQWAADLNTCLSILDQHDHTAGNGTAITPSGLNINSELSFNNNNASNLRAVRLFNQSVPLVLPTDRNEFQNINGDIYWVDSAGNQIRLTQAGSIVGTAGSITGLVSPASASYQAISSKFVWQSAANISADMDFGAAIFRNPTINSFGVSLNAPPSLGADFSLTLPTLPVTKQIMRLDSAGNMDASLDVDNTTIDIAANTLEVKDGGITPSKLAASVLALIMPTGVILPYAADGASAPTGFAYCQGQIVTIAGYPDLYAVIGTTWGYGLNDGLTFNLPDTRGLFLRGVAHSSANDPDRALRSSLMPGGNNGDNVGSFQGYSNANHNHGFAVPSLDVNANTSSSYVAGNTSIAGSSDPSSGVVNNATVNKTGLVTNGDNSATSFEARPINVYVNYIIKT